MTTLPAPPPPPPPSRPTLDFPRGLRFTFEDPDWIKKVLIGSGMALLAVFIIGSIWLMGYFVRVVQRAARGEERPLPEWDDWGGMLGDGLKVFGIYLCYLVGALLPFIAIFVVLVVVVGAAGTARGGREVSDALGGVMGLGFVGLYGVLWLVMIALMIYLPAAMTRFAMTGRFGAGFEVMENLAFIRRNLVNYALTLVLYLVVSFLAQFGIVLCCVGVLPLSFWAMCVLAWALGETVRLDPTGVV